LLLFFAWLRANQKALFAATEGVDFFSALQHFSQVPFVVDRRFLYVIRRATVGGSCCSPPN